MNSFFNCYVDLDGVVAAWDKKLLEATGKTIDQFDHKSHVWASIQKYNDTIEPFFENLDKLEDSDILMDFIIDNFKYHSFLSAHGFTPSNVKEQKLVWVSKHYPTVSCNLVPKSSDKAKFATPNSILIDDREKSITPWVKAGGIGILHKDAASTITELRKILEI
jgi:hypothetical protein